MRIVRYAIDGKVEYGILSGNFVQVIEGDPFQELNATKQVHELDEVKLLSPCSPTKIVALGLNYHSHAKELKAKIPNAPLIFLKPPTAVIGPDENIVYPSVSSRVDYEGELGVVIKKKMWLVSEENAFDYVLGYTCFNDVTARDIQQMDKQWTRSKSFDTFAAIGPWIETELDPENADVETYLNGELKQKGNTNDLIYSIRTLINFISHTMTLLPGDIIATGTPSGIGPMFPGDTVEIKIGGIGTLRNPIVKGEY